MEFKVQAGGYCLQVVQYNYIVVFKLGIIQCLIWQVVNFEVVDILESCCQKVVGLLFIDGQYLDLFFYIEGNVIIVVKLNGEVGDVEVGFVLVGLLYGNIDGIYYGRFGGNGQGVYWFIFFFVVDRQVDIFCSCFGEVVYLNNEWIGLIGYGYWIGKLGRIYVDVFFLYGLQGYEVEFQCGVVDGFDIGDVMLKIGNMVNYFVIGFCSGKCLLLVGQDF